MTDLDIPPNFYQGEQEPERPSGEYPCDLCDYVGKELQHLQMHVERKHGIPSEDNDPTSEGVTEQAPKPSPTKGNLFGKLKNKFGNAKEQAKQKPKQQKSRKGPRVSIASDVTDAWYGMGRRLEFTPHYPAGRMLQWQAPAAGDIIDTALAGSFVDRLLVQPIWQSKDKWENVAFLTMPPIMLYMIQGARMRQAAAIEAGENETAAQLQRWIAGEMEALGWILRRSATKMAPMIAEAKARREEEDEALRAAFGDAFGELPAGEDPVRLMLEGLFTPPNYQQSDTQQENE